ncbi:NYN domain-containing protein [Actinomadura rayongensis]|uniref:NYN domain-containing protein n=1 Tax=Actinomadura rayongensis TaxID=1429076 RepID=A0A6I4WA34_9ACTN|nr:NYN domain-containing protein [Actinomadura rayongensis]MXQ65135.1 NYN domain-containing protein [Actinomadura rayongensis]
MDRCALFVDAGYLLADGAMAVHGTRHRDAVSWDFGGLLQLLGGLARDRTGCPLLRCYWYEATAEGRRAPEHESLADLPGLKLRLGRVRPGRREGVDAEIHRDLMTLARNGALADAVVVSGDEDIARVVADAQEFGVRVTVLHVAVDGNWTISRSLRQECDDLIEIGSGHLRPYVNLLSSGDASTGPLANGHSSHSSNGSGTPAALAPAPRSASSAPPSTPLTGQPVPAAEYAARDKDYVARDYASAAPEYGASGLTGLTPPPAATPPPFPAPPATPPPFPTPPTAAPQSSGTNYQPPASAPPQNSGANYLPQTPPQQPGPYTGPQQIAPRPVQQAAPSLADAVKAAHQEGQDFGESVARDAPALWLEAVLARKPRMPSDLEARLLQGSSLPIDFLLHDEVRHALRRGFWDALERARR